MREVLFLHLMDEEIIQLIILVPAAILSLIAGIFLIIRGKEKFDKGMIYLGISYILMICLLIVWGFNLVSLFITYTLMFFVYIGVNFFTQFTFHTDKNRNFKWIMIATISNYIIQVIPAILFHFNLYTDYISYIGRLIDNTFSITWAVIVFGWLAYSGIKSYNQIKNKNVQPWIKKRLLLVIYAAFINMFVNVPNLIDDLTRRVFHDYVFYIQMIMIATIMVMQYLAWIMPKGLKKFFNHDYIIEKEEDTGLSEEKILKQMTEGNENK